LSLDGKGAIDKVVIALTNAGVTPIQVTDAACALIGKAPDEKAFAEAGRLAAEKSSPTADRRGSVEYKRDMARVLVTRALRKAVERAGGC
jgi:aerobic carbon-monoxide dehydrogenase medium subunit